MNMNNVKTKVPRVGNVVQVLWNGPCGLQWYTGKLMKRLRPHRHNFLISYDDGDLVEQDLNDDSWKYIGSDTHFAPGQLHELLATRERAKIVHSNKRQRSNTIHNCTEREKKTRRYETDFEFDNESIWANERKEDHSSTSVGAEIEKYDDDEAVMRKLVCPEIDDVASSLSSFTRYSRNSYETTVQSVHVHVQDTSTVEVAAKQELSSERYRRTDVEKSLPPRKRKLLHTISV